MDFFTKPGDTWTARFFSSARSGAASSPIDKSSQAGAPDRSVTAITGCSATVICLERRQRDECNRNQRSALILSRVEGEHLGARRIARSVAVVGSAAG